MPTTYFVSDFKRTANILPSSMMSGIAFNLFFVVKNM